MKYLIPYSLLCLFLTAALICKGQDQQNNSLQLKLLANLAVKNQLLNKPQPALISQPRLSVPSPTHPEVSEWFLPEYARENPANWAPLCHMEANIEKQLPVGIWINWEDSPVWKDQLQQTASLRLRLFTF
ncbi:MAG: hypothetical protein AAF587_31880 [Bacteroidota bacterium]